MVKSIIMNKTMIKTDLLQTEKKQTEGKKWKQYLLYKTNIIVV